MTNLKLKKISKRNRLIFFDDEPRGIIPSVKLPVLPLSYNENGFMETEIAPEKAKEIKDSIDSYAWNRVLDWLAIQERSSHECKIYLKKLFIPDDVTENFIARLKKLNYVNNQRFAELFISSLIQKGKSKLEIKNKLYEKTADLGQTELWLDEFYNPECELENLRNNLQKLLKRWQNLPDKKRSEKIISTLTRHGFAYQMIRNELTEMEIEYENYDC